MSIDAQCKSCQKRYRVNESLAGRVAECKHCGAKFRIPYRSAVVRLEDELDAEMTQAAAASASAFKAGAAHAAAGNVRTFEEYAPLVPKPKKSKLDEPTENNVCPIPLPAIVTDLWLPIGIMVVCFGLALFLSVNAVLHSYGVGAGFIMIGLVVAGLFIAVIPLTVKAIDSASGTFDFKVSNSLWTQSAAIVSVPILGATIGLLTGGVTGTIVGTGIGVVVAIPLTMLLLQVSIGAGLQAGVLASLFFLLGTGGTVVAVWLVAAVLFPIWYLNLPWGDAPAVKNTQVAANVQTPASPVADAAAPAAAAEAPAAAPDAAAAPQAAPVAAPAEPATAAPEAPAVAGTGNHLFNEKPAISAAVLPSTPDAAGAAAGNTITVATTVAPGRPVDELLPPMPSSPPVPSPAETIAKAPTTAPAATAELAAQKQWVVTVMRIERPDTSAINQEMHDVGAMIPQARADADRARDVARAMEAHDMVREHNPRGVEGAVRFEKKYRHSKAERGKASAAALRVENEVKKIRSRIAQLERERTELENTVTISGHLEDGTLVQVDAGPRDARFAELLVPGSRWRVEGPARVAIGVLHVKPRVFVPFKAEDRQAAAPEPRS